MVQHCQPRSLQCIYVCTGRCFLPAAAAGSRWRRSREAAEESSCGDGWDGMAQLCHLAGALLQNRLFLRLPLLCSQWKVIGINVPSKHSMDAHTAYIFFFFNLTILLQCFVLVLQVCEAPFCLPCPSKVNTCGDVLLLPRPFLIPRELTELPL